VLLDALSLFESSEMQSRVFVHQHMVIVRICALLLDPTLDIVVLFIGPKGVVGIVLYVGYKATVNVAFP
jgi:hypothetical protein